MSIEEVLETAKRSLLVAVEQPPDEGGLPDEYSEAQVVTLCTESMQGLQALHRLIGKRRAQAVRSLLAMGLSYAQIADVVGLSRQRVEQIANG